ncbi:MAG: DUF455 family protein [Deltaproteobacteria bacterium]|nr:DUF455 family protein [Deltaproteobacteria bacterium]
MTTETDTTRLALRILQGTTLEDKLAAFDPALLVDGVPLPAVPPREPGRAPSLRIISQGERLPRPGQLTAAAARAECLHRFANHELQALELMAWAVLAFPAMPWSFRQGIMNNLHDEQRHFRLYLGRLAAHGLRFGDLACNGNFWAQAVRLGDPLAFLCAVGLTFETANLDFALLYRDAFRTAGAEAEASVMQRIHDDEVGHVAWSASWVRRLARPAETLLQAYQRVTPFPLGLHRAKGRNFVVSSRVRAGLEADFVEATRVARSPQEQHPRRGRPG